MISIRDAEEILKKEYHIDNFKYVVKELLLPDFTKDEHEVSFNNNQFESVTQLGTSEKCDVTVYEVILKEGTQNRRVTITQEMFRILRGQGINNAIVAFSNADCKNYRLSLLTSKYEFEGDKIVKILSNPRRYSYSLGYGTKTKTAYEFLISKGKVNSLEELIGRFSVEVVNKQFYNEIALAFTKLVGGVREGKTYAQELGIHGVTDKNKYAEFAVRLIGRIVFCWFLKEKKSENGIPLVPDSMLSVESTNTAGIYYHDVLEPLFFELLNTKQERRKGKFAKEEIYAQIPYLNGGLFSPHQPDDHYKYAFATESGTYGLVTIPNEWFRHFYEVLSQYNFTVDENTSYDIELSIDPEMLGRIFENLLAEINPETGENAKKSTGSFYTPRDVVDYMVDNSIFEYLKGKTNIEDERLKALISYGKEDDELAVFNKAEKKAIINALYTVTVLDPACGSGAFPIGMLQKIVYILQEVDPEANLWFDKATENISILMKREFEKKFNAGSLDYIRKLSVIQNSIFGVDIQPIAVEIARLRCFLSLVIEETVDDNEYNRGVNPLPNLDFKFIIANTLLELPYDDFAEQISMFENQDHIAELKAVREEYFSANDLELKNELKLEFANIQKAMFQETIANSKIASARYHALSNWSPFENQSTNWFDPEWMFGIKDGFDIVIGNPPYISTKEIDPKSKVAYEKMYGFSDDTYNLFTFRGLMLTKEEGTLNYIIPKTFWTTQTKSGMRNKILSKTIKYIFDAANPFEAVMVDTCIIQILNSKYNGISRLKFFDGSTNLSAPELLNEIEQSIYINTQNSAIFTPTEFNLKIANKYGKKVKDLYDVWWPCIKTSKDIEKNKVKLEEYRSGIKPGDIVLLGCLTEGGQGLATANNGKYIAVRTSTKWANNIRISRPKKLLEAMQRYKIPMSELQPYVSISELLETASEKEIARIFDKLKDKYGRDIFGQGYIYKLITDDQLADVSALSEDEKENGIDDSRNYYVPYDKGDKDGNRWYLETPFAIAWSKENVRFLKTDPKARYQGYQFFFREGFCWNNVLNPNARLLKTKLKQATVNDVGSMSLMSVSYLPNAFFVSLLNSNFLFDYYRQFINCTVNIQINDLRQIPIIIPTKNELNEFLDLFNKIYSIKKESGSDEPDSLKDYEKQLDALVNSLYSVDI